MNTKLVAGALLAVTGALCVVYPQLHIGATPRTTEPNSTVIGPPLATSNSEISRIDAVFVLDTTGSMGGLLDAAKEKIWSIATTMAQADPAPEIRLGLVAYRDRGDAYVTKVVDLSQDLDSVYAALMDFNAAGGGDGPESVNQALYEAVERISWSDDPHTYKTIFLVGDAPAHMDYQNDVKYPLTLDTAKRRGIIVNAIQCGTERRTTQTWQQVAQLGGGEYLQVNQNGSAFALSTPMDGEIASLSQELDATRMYYGSNEARADKQRKLNATAKLHAHASESSRARRATFNVTPSGEANYLGDQELIDDVTSGRVEFEALPSSALPDTLKSMPQAQRKAWIEEIANRRKELKDRIKVLTEERETFLAEEVEKAQSSVKNSLDHQLFRAIREQARAKGFSYDALTPKY